MFNKYELNDLDSAKKVWTRLQKIGFNSDESIELIDMLIGLNGDYIYFKELRDVIRNQTLRDDVAAKIILALSGTYEGRGGDGSAFYIPKNDRDKEIQSAISEELISPHGKKSLYIALEKLGYTVSHEEVMQTLQSMKDIDNCLLDKLSIYSLELKEVGIDGNYDEVDRLVSEIAEMENKKQNKLMPDYIKISFKIGELNNKELQKKYISQIKKIMPKKHEVINYDDLRDKATQKVKQDKDFMDMYNSMQDRDKAFEQLQYRIQEEYEKIQEEANKINFLRDESYKAIAYALSPDPADYIIGYKKAFLTEQNWDEKLEYISSFWNEVHDMGEDLIKEKFLSDKEIKSVLKEGLDSPNLTQDNRESIEFYLNKFH
jgi:hypothetical protein